MRKLSKNNILYWTPRIVSLLFIVFLSLFALDVFNEYRGWLVVIPLFIHLIPSFILLIVVVLSWRYDLIGALLFLIIACCYILMVGLDRHWSWYAAISLPALLISVLFLLNWFVRKK